MAPTIRASKIDNRQLPAEEDKPRWSFRLLCLIFFLAAIATPSFYLGKYHQKRIARAEHNYTNFVPGQVVQHRMMPWRGLIINVVNEGKIATMRVHFPNGETVIWNDSATCEWEEE